MVVGMKTSKEFARGEGSHFQTEWQLEHHGDGSPISPVSPLTKKQPPLSEKVTLFCLEFNFRRDLLGMVKEKGEAQSRRSDQPNKPWLAAGNRGAARYPSHLRSLQGAAFLLNREGRILRQEEHLTKDGEEGKHMILFKKKWVNRLKWRKARYGGQNTPQLLMPSRAQQTTARAKSNHLFYI